MSVVFDDHFISVSIGDTTPRVTVGENRRKAKTHVDREKACCNTSNMINYRREKISHGIVLIEQVTSHREEISGMCFFLVHCNCGFV